MEFSMPRRGQQAHNGCFSHGSFTGHAAMPNSLAARIEHQHEAIRISGALK